jgi:hypothetical protein
VFGIVYLALGILGLTMGKPDVIMGVQESRAFSLGPLMLGTADHGIHILLGAIFLAGGLFTKK